MKKIMLFTIIASLVMACAPMDENYSEYLENIPTYSPKVTNLQGTSYEAGSITLTWDLPTIDLARDIEIVYSESTATAETISDLGLITTYTINGLKLQGHTFTIYTIDEYGNRSVPVSKIFTPIPGRE